MSSAPKPLPFFFVGKALTEERKRLFMQNKYPVLCQQLGRDDTRSIWYSRDHIVKLLEEIDHAGGDGLRVYLGAYEPTHEYKGQLCLMMNATRRKIVDGVARSVNVILEEEPDYTERSTQPRSGGGKSADWAGDKSTSGPKDFNLGQPCPPRCD